MKKIKEVFRIFIKNIKWPLIYALIITLPISALSYFKADSRFIVGFGSLLFTIYVIHLVFFSNQSDKSSIMVNFLFFIFLGYPPLIYGVSLLISYLSSIYNLPIIANGDTWIVFSGSILGGAVTMLAVIFTITFEKRKYQTNKSISLLPTMEVDHIYFNRSSSDLDNESHSQIFLEENIMKIYGKSSCYKGKFISSIYKITNTSNNIIREIRISRAIINTDENTYTIFQKATEQNSKLPNIILPNTSHNFDIILREIVQDIKNDSKIKRKSFIKGKLIIEFEYFDINKTKNLPYRHIFTSEIAIDFNESLRTKNNKLKNIEDGKLITKEDYNFLSFSHNNELDLSIFDKLS